MAKTGVLFVCLGNICRSPLAEHVFRHLAAERGLADSFMVDSAGTGAWHVGEAPDARSAEVALRHGITLDGQARQVTTEDFATYDLILAMDRDNLRTIEKASHAAHGDARLELLRRWDPDAHGDLEVPDPYYGAGSGFDHVYDMVERSCRALLDELAGQGRRALDDDDLME